MPTSRNGWLDPLVGRTVSRVTVDRYAPPVVLWMMYDGGPAARVEINGPFEWTVGAITTRLDPGQAADVGPVLACIGGTCTGANETDDGTLILEFDGDRRIQVPSEGDLTEPWWFDIGDPAHLAL